MGRKRRFLPLLFPALLLAIAIFFYSVNKSLTPVFVDYAEVQTEKIAAHVISKAINSRSEGVVDAGSVIENIVDETSGELVGVNFNTEKINRKMAEIHTLVESHLEQAEAGNLDMLPMQDNIQYDPQEMESNGGVVFFVPVGQATNIPLLGNLGPKIPIRFHVIGDVHATIETDIREFGINNAYVEVNVLLTVNVQIVVPLATQKSVVEQKIPVAIGIIPGPIPQVSTRGGDPPQIEVPIELPKKFD